MIAQVSLRRTADGWQLWEWSETEGLPPVAIPSSPVAPTLERLAAWMMRGVRGKYARIAAYRSNLAGLEAMQEANP